MDSSAARVQCAAVAALLVFLISPQARSEPLDLSRGGSGEPVIVLSIDAGASDEGAEEILDVLRMHNVRTTLFLTGEFIERNPELVIRIVEDGHEVANHTWSHPHLTRWASERSHRLASGVDRDFIVQQLERTSEAFERLTRQPMKRYWRAPYGEHNRQLLEWAAEAGWKHVGWTRGRSTSLDTLDWVSDRRSKNYLPPARLLERVLEFEQVNGAPLEGAIILMHLGSARPVEERMVTILPAMIDELTSRGFRFVTVSELVSGSGQSSR